MDAVTIACACAEAAWSNDQAVRNLEIQLVSVSPGHAVASMIVTEAMLNGYEFCHGGFIFALADVAFAVACNTYNQRTVSQHCDIAFINPARRGDHLLARASERSRAGRSGIYDVTVTCGQTHPIAEFRGHSRTIGGEIITGPKNREA